MALGRLLTAAVIAAPLLANPLRADDAAAPASALPVNTQLQAFYNVVRPDGASTWQLRFQIQFLFPK